MKSFPFSRLLACVLLPCTTVVHAADAPDVVIRHFLSDSPIGRVDREMKITVVFANRGPARKISEKFTLPPGVNYLGYPKPLTAIGEGELVYRLLPLITSKPVQGNAVYQLLDGEKILASATLPLNFLPAREVQKLPYIPEPLPVKTQMLVGAHNCPLWEADKFSMWDQVLYKHPERVPALGFYAQENPEIADWETKWAVEHGISYFVYCWYRDGQGGAIKTRFGGAIHDSLFKSRFAGKMKFTIMWENQSKGTSGVSGERDLMQNLLPYWLKNYFQNTNYLKIDNKPLLFIYRPEYLVNDLGSVENVRLAFEKMRAACRAAGFDGLYLLGEYRGTDPKILAQMKQLGLDYTFAYCWYLGGSPSPDKAVPMQMELIKKTQAANVIPQVVTVSQAWSGWRDEGTIWKLPPADWEKLLREAKNFTQTLPPNELGSKTILLDNWNEWSEGHYIAPYREYGFGYLDAVRRVFSDAPEAHDDLLPEDIGRGPYDTVFRKNLAHQDQIWALGAKVVTKGAPEAGLIGFWSFDEAEDAPVTLDYAGHKLGGEVRGKRAPGLDGNALLCDGGSVQIAESALLNPTVGLTVECWVKTELAGQDNKWLVNRVYNSGDSGFRLGILGGKPCFEVPQTPWSHHLQAATPLPTGRWVHLAGTFDGQAMRIFVDGQEQGMMPRPGPLKPNSSPLTLGSYETGHAAHFTGLFDEVKIYDHALDAGAVKAHAQRAAR